MRVDKFSALIPDASMVQLETCGEYLHRHQAELDADPEFVEGLRQELIDLAAEIIESDEIPVGTREHLVSKQEHLVGAIDLSPLTGLGPAVEAANATVGEGVAANAPVDHPLKQRFWRTMTYVAALPVIITPQLVMIQKGADTITSVMNAVEAVRETAGPPAIEPSSHSEDDDVVDAEVVADPEAPGS